MSTKSNPRRSSWHRCTLLLASLTLLSCGDGESAHTPGAMRQARAGTSGTVTLTGAGATFPYPLYSKWFSTFGQQHPVRINYQSIGSGGGIRQISEGTVDFGASDAPMTEEEIDRAPGILHLPTVLGAVAVAYNLPGIEQPIRLDGAVLADIFLGRTRKWNDLRVAQLNPGVPLPDRDILVVYRSDGSGTTYVFTDYLSVVSPAFRQQVGTGKAVRWPVGLGAKGNEGVAGQLRQTEGAIGYVEVAYARQTGLETASIANRVGEFVQPTVEATTAAAEGIAERLGPNRDFRISIVNADGPRAYPISSWTYLLVPSHIPECSKARALGEVIRWSLSQGGDAALELHYAPLPETVRAEVLAELDAITCGPDRQRVAATS